MSSANFKSREEFKKEKQLEEDRKKGLAPAEIDADTGNVINPHIPQYISQAPWYLSQGAPSLKHQRSAGDQFDPSKPATLRGFAGPSATKFRKGACENCGSMSHKSKDCLDRPRKVGAKYSGKHIAADEVIQQVNYDFEGKRDRWNGYDTTEHKRVLEQYEKVEAERRRLREEEARKRLLEKAAEPAEGEASLLLEEVVDEDKEREGYVAPQITHDAKKKEATSNVMNLRMREDTAKYLRNLDVNSSYYDPKTRSMREAPNALNGEGEDDYLGDNAMLMTGDAKKMMEEQQFAWEAEKRGLNVHMHAAPSHLEFLKRDFERRKEELEKKKRQDILAKYGGGEETAVEEIPAELRMAQTETYVEYNKDARPVIPGASGVVADDKDVNRMPRSRYEEDVLHNNHKSVWGSFWSDGKWGYACCHSFVKTSYCVGEAGKQAYAESMNNEDIMKKRAELFAANRKQVSDEREEAEKTRKKNKKNVTQEEDPEEFDRQVKEAMRLEEERQKKLTVDDRKRKYNAATRGGDADEEKPEENYEVTAAEMEAYMLKKKRFDDPMANYQDSS